MLQFPPFSTPKPGTDSGLGGTVLDIFESMKIFINHFDYDATLQFNRAFGAKLPNGSFTGMIGSLMNNETDMCGPFIMNEERSKVVEFSEPISDTYMGIMSGVVETQKDPFIIFQVFTGPCISSDFGNSNRWFVRHVYGSTSFRMLLFIWFGTCLVLLYSYQGGILSAFAFIKLQPKIASLDDLLNDISIEPIAIANSAGEKAYRNLQNTKYESIWERMKGNLVIDLVGSVPPWMERVHKGQATFTSSTHFLKARISDRFRKTGECGLAVSNIELGYGYVALAFRKEFINTDFLKQFNRGIRLFNEGGLAHFSLLRSNRIYEKCAGGNTSVTKPLNLIDLMGAFIVLFPPFSTHKPGTDSGLGGTVLDIYESMKIFINHFDYDATLQFDRGFGGKLPNGSFTGMIGSLMNNETDMCGPFMMNEERSKVVEFSEPFFDSYMGIMSGVVETQKDPLIIFKVFTGLVWISLFASIFFMASAATAVYFVLPTNETRSLPTVFSKYLWSFQISLLNKNFGYSCRWFMQHVYDSTSFRMLLLTWFGPCLVLLYSYQRGILSAFASTKLQPKIASLDDLLNDKSIEPIVIVNSADEKAFRNLQSTRYETIWGRVKASLVEVDLPGTVPPWTERVHKGQAIFADSAHHLKARIGDWFQKTGECGLAVSKIELGYGYVALALRNEFLNTDFLKQLNRGIRLFNEGGLAHFSLLRSNRYFEKCSGENTAVSKPLNLIDLMGTFIVLGTGFSAASILFLIELLHCRISKTRNQTP
ncbi:hypothetical protein JTE90_000453 [Oedothorax gibbosus]|uniref:Ionotropic glutamate receptor C-terminal domain-containing protein n=1 Tax=Oedothorax gibbosus TaxID=931172 RepID=A0AAV6UFR6_9ARAC|nr:hypothetical protein JTE90_000453 [Oedothorax gibbosus]